MAVVKRIIIVRWLHRKSAASLPAAYQHRVESAQLWDFARRTGFRGGLIPKRIEPPEGGSRLAGSGGGSV